jgi:hypothetical protein
MTLFTLEKLTLDVILDLLWDIKQRSRQHCSRPILILFITATGAGHEITRLPASRARNHRRRGHWLGVIELKKAGSRLSGLAWCWIYEINRFAFILFVSFPIELFRNHSGTVTEQFPAEGGI